MIYDKPVRVLLVDMINQFRSENREPFSTAEAIEWFSEHYPLIKEGTVRAHLRRFSSNDAVRLHFKPQPGEALLFKLDRSTYRFHDPKHDPPEILSEPEAAEPPEPDDSPYGLVNTIEAAEFAYERDLQNFLSKNLHLIEPELRLYEDEDHSINGIEFDAGGRRIDILAIDAQGNLVVIELKVSKGYDKVVGQILRYMSWIKQNQAEPSQDVRGIIIAREISKDLSLATALVPNIDLYEYELSVNLRRPTAS